MSQAPLDIVTRSRAGAAIQGPKTASVLRARRMRRRRYGMVASIAILALFGLALLLTMATSLPDLLTGRRAPPSAMPAPVTTASIVHHPATDRCRRATFNNETGRVVETNKPCESDVVYDANGLPVPAGTARRLEAISRSFSK